MFQVPNHLPRSNSGANGANELREVDSVLDLIEPLFKGGNVGISVSGVQDVREQLQSAITSNKVGR